MVNNVSTYVPPSWKAWTQVGTMTLSEFQNLLDAQTPEQQAEIIHGALNNFFGKMPGGFEREMIEDVGDLIFEIKIQEIMNLFATIDAVLEELSFDIKTVAEENKIARDDYAQKKRFHVKLFPVYKKLREMGHSHTQLTA